jgi:hypothetical protein
LELDWLIGFDSQSPPLTPEARDTPQIAFLGPFSERKPAPFQFIDNK